MDVGIHEILSCNALILHLVFFFFFETITQKFTLAYFYHYLINYLSLQHIFLSSSYLLTYPPY